jgi:uncharacterized protein
MRLTACFAVAAAALLAAPAAHAVPLRGLYEASVPVADQNPQGRDPALRQALQTVLVRVTGTRNLPEPAASTLLARATTLVQGYGYEAAPTGNGLRLRARFDPRAVEAALRSQGVAVWGANRLSHIVWLALRDDGQPRGVLDGAAIAARAGAVLATAEARGLPFTFPSLDATDRQLVTFNELWSGSYAGAVGASRRYNADVVLVGRVGRENNRWIGRWTLLNNAGAAEEWGGVHDTLEQALAAGVDELADRQAQRFSTQAGSAQELRLQVTGVNSLADYGRALNYLRGLNPVRNAQVESAQGDALVLRLRVEGDPRTLARVIAAGSVMRPDDNSGFGSELSYVLVR